MSATNFTALYTAGLLVIQENKLLLAFSKNKKAWYLPGGKVDQGETTMEAIQREILEELNLNLNPEKLSFYCHISAPAYGEDQHIIMEQDCFLYPLDQEIQASQEIEAVRYFNYSEYKKEDIQVVGVLEVFEILEKDGLLSGA